MQEQSTDRERLVKRLETHRWVVTPESAKVLGTFRDSMERFIEQHPELIGVTIYGSHTKGTARAESSSSETSDVDSFLFVDAEQISTEENADALGVSDIQSELWIKANETIGRPFREMFATVAGYDADQLKDIRVRLLSKKRIDADIDRMRTFITENQVGSEHALFGPDPETLDMDLPAIFYLQLGHNMDATRAYVLRKLEQLGPVGDAVWKDFFLGTTLTKEGAKVVKGIDANVKFGSNRARLYPQTVASAISYFKLENTESIYETN